MLVEDVCVVASFSLVIVVVVLAKLAVPGGVCWGILSEKVAEGAFCQCFHTLLISGKHLGEEFFAEPPRICLCGWFGGRCLLVIGV